MKNKHSCTIGVVAVALVLSGLAVAVTGETNDFTGTFKVDRAILGNVGANPYFILEPGYRLHYKCNDGATLTITVSDEIKLVDGVQTRVVEEREEKDGKPTEISRNYFAIDKKTKDVYYFGEDVDEYKDGKIASHPGTWLSGVKGAKFGLMMPGKPKVGDKFQQEVAPNVAMDRYEIVAVDAKVKTPAGTFKNCVRTKEGSSLEPGTSEKLYAPGVGLIKDGETVLVKIEKPTKKKGAKTAFKGWELYVWQDDGETYFSLLLGTNRLKTDDEIAKTAVKGIDAIKSKLDELKPGEFVFVGGKKLTEPPPKDQAAQVAEYGKKIGLKMQGQSQ